MKDLMPDNGCATATAPRPAVRPPRTFATARDAIADLERRHGPRAAWWTYHNAAGEPCGVVVRWDGPAGKNIRPVSCDGDGWKIGAMRTPRPLYNLPQLREADPGTLVYIVEGEKCSDALAALGMLTTTSAGGSSAARMTDWTPLAGRSVVILPDADEAGRKYAADVVERLQELTPPATVRIAPLPGLAEHGDIYDFIQARRQPGADDASIKAEIDRLVANTAVAEPASPLPDGPILTCMADIAPRDVRWLWPGRIPLGRLTLLVGRPGEGKSFLTTDLAARVSTGSPWPDGSGLAAAGSVILVCAEDDPADTIAPRLLAHHADVEKIHLLTAVRHHQNGEPYEVMFTLTDLNSLETSLKRHPDCRLVVVDPIGSFLGGRTDAHRDNEVRSVLAPVGQLAEKYGPAVVMVAHRRKALGNTADDLALGSRAFTGIARAVWHLSRDTEDKRRRLLLSGKINIAAEGTGMAFSIGGEPARIWWEKDPVELSADDALAVEHKAERRGPEPEGQREAADWLSRFLAGGAKVVKDIEAEAKAAGITWRTLRRAKDGLPIIVAKAGFGDGWTWRLRPAPDPSKPGHLRPHTNNLDTFEKPGRLRVLDPKNGDSKTGEEARSLEGCQEVQVSEDGHLRADDDRPPLTDADAEAALAESEVDV